MASLAYDNSMDLLEQWESLSWVFVAMKSSYTPDRVSDSVLADIVADELTASGYVRSGATSVTRDVDTTAHQIIYQCDDPDFGPADTGETMGGVVLAVDNGDDASNTVVLFLEQSPPRATDGSELIYTLAAGAVATLAQT